MDANLAAVGLVAALKDPDCVLLPVKIKPEQEVVDVKLPLPPRQIDTPLVDGPAGFIVTFTDVNPVQPANVAANV